MDSSNEERSDIVRWTWINRYTHEIYEVERISSLVNDVRYCNPMPDEFVNLMLLTALKFISRSTLQLII